jgi:hypothetical protein
MQRNQIFIMLPPIGWMGAIGCELRLPVRGCTKSHIIKNIQIFFYGTSSFNGFPTSFPATKG